MSLFQITGESILAEAMEPEITTPLGTVTNELIAGGNEDRFEARETRFLPNGSYIVYGGGRLFEAELLVANVWPPLPEHMKLAGCRAFVWRVKPSREGIRNLRFVADWLPDLECEYYGYCGGQWLDALSFESCDTRVVIGTEDDFMLRERMKRRDRLPNLFADDNAKQELVRYRETGMEVILPGPQPHGIFQIHFVVAWSLTANNDAAGFAADLSGAFILQNAGVS